MRVEVGTMAPIDVVQAQAEQATRRQGLVTAENAKRTAELSLKRLIVSGTEDPNWVATLDPVDRPDFQPEPVDTRDGDPRGAQPADRSRDRQEDRREQHHHAQISAQPDAADRRPAGELRPAGRRRPVSACARTTTSSAARSPRPFRAALSQALSSLFENRYPRWTAQVNMTYPLGLSSQEAAVARARVQLSQIQAQMQADGADGGERRDERRDPGSQCVRVGAGGAGGARPVAAAPRGRAEQVRGRHVDELLRRPGAARPERRAQQRAARDPQLPESAGRVRAPAADHAVEREHHRHRGRWRRWRAF